MRTLANSLLTTSLAVVAALPSCRRMAADLDVASTVDAVTVYPDGASVTRVVTVDLPSGDNTLVRRISP